MEVASAVNANAKTDGQDKIVRAPHQPTCALTKMGWAFFWVREICFETENIQQSKNASFFDNLLIEKYFLYFNFGSFPIFSENLQRSWNVRLWKMWMQRWGGFQKTIQRRKVWSVFGVSQHLPNNQRLRSLLGIRLCSRKTGLRKKLRGPNRR